MASPLPTGKQTVDLAAPVRVSRIRRDPPPVVKMSAIRTARERDKAAMIAGIVLFAVALVVAVLGLSGVSSWSPSQYEIHINRG